MRYPCVYSLSCTSSDLFSSSSDIGIDYSQLAKDIRPHFEYHLWRTPARKSVPTLPNRLSKPGEQSRARQKLIADVRLEPTTSRACSVLPADHHSSQSRLFPVSFRGFFSRSIMTPHRRTPLERCKPQTLPLWPFILLCFLIAKLLYHCIIITNVV